MSTELVHVPFHGGEILAVKSEIMADEMERSAEQWRAQAIKWVQERDAARAEVLDARRRWCAEVQALHLVRDALEAECNTARSALAERNDARECQEAAEARVRDLEGAIEGAPHMPWCRVSPCTCWKSRTLATPSTPAPAAEAPGPGLREAVSLAREVLDLDAKAKALYGSNWDVERTDALSDILTRMRDIAPPIARALLSALSAAAPPSAPPEGDAGE